MAGNAVRKFVKVAKFFMVYMLSKSNNRL